MIGRVSPRMKKIYGVVLEAKQAAIAFLRPGVTTVQADRVARDVIEKAGFGKQFGHGLGHGIGRDIHELPTMRKNGGEDELRPGNDRDGRAGHLSPRRRGRPHRG